MPNTSRRELYEKANQERCRVRDWLLPYMASDGLKSSTKDVFRAEAVRVLGVSKTAFNMGWIAAIEQSGRLDWYEPLRLHRRKN